MAKTYTSDASSTQEGVARKTDGRLIPFIGIGLFILIGIIVTMMALSRRNAPAAPSDAIQNAPIAAPGNAPRPTSGS